MITFTNWSQIKDLLFMGSWEDMIDSLYSRHGYYVVMNDKAMQEVTFAHIEQADIQHKEYLDEIQKEKDLIAKLCAK